MRWQLSGVIIRSAYLVNSWLRALGLANKPGMRDIRGRLRRAILGLVASGVPVKVDGMTLLVRPSPASIAEYILRPFEPFTTEIFRSVLKSGHMVADVGAQFGWYTLIAAKRVGARGRVWAFEPVPSNFDFLVRNIVLNGVQDIVCPVQKAIGSSRGVIELTLYAESDAHGAWARPGAAVKGVIMVECVTLDDYLRDNHVDVIKMDIEGAEPFALDGAVRTIERAEKMVLIAELNPELLRRAGVEPRDYLQQLRQLGFDISIIDEKERSLRPLSQDLIIEIEETPGWYANLYCEKG